MGGAAGDALVMYLLGRAGKAMMPAGGAAALPGLGRSATAVKLLDALAASPKTQWLLNNTGMGAVYGQLMNDAPIEGAEFGTLAGLGVGAANSLAKRAAPFLASAAEKSLGRVIAPGKEAWKAFIGREAPEIINELPLRAASPFQEGGGLKGITDYAEQQAGIIRRALDAAYKAQTQADVGPQLKSIRDRIRTTATNLIQSGVDLAPEARQTLEDIRAGLATGRGLLNPKDTNITVLQRSFDQLYDVMGSIGNEMLGTATDPNLGSYVQKTAQKAIQSGVGQRASGAVRDTLNEIFQLVEDHLHGTRTGTEGVAQAIDALKMKFGQTNAAGDFISSHPQFTEALQNLADQVRSYGPEINGNQLRKVAADWGKIVAGAKGTGWLTSLADESVKGALKAGRGPVEQARDRVMGPAVARMSDEASFWINLGEAAADTAERRTGHKGGGLWSTLAKFAGFGAGQHGATMAGHGGIEAIGAGTLVAGGMAAVTRAMESPFWNLASAKLKLFAANAIRKGSGPLMQQAARRFLLEMALLEHGGLAALGQQDLTAAEAASERQNMVGGRGVTPGVLNERSPDDVYGPAGNSPDERLNLTTQELQNYDMRQGRDDIQRQLDDPHYRQDQIDQAIEDERDNQDTPHPEGRQQLMDSLGLGGAQAMTAGFGKLPAWLETQLLDAPNLGSAHPHLQKLANVIASQTTPLNLAFLGDQALRPLASGTKLAASSR